MNFVGIYQDSYISGVLGCSLTRCKMEMLNILRILPLYSNDFKTSKHEGDVTRDFIQIKEGRNAYGEREIDC